MYRVIIADDEALECKVLEKIIGENFLEAKVLPSASNGLELIAGIEKELPDIAIVDINMPGLNGLDAIEILRVKHPGIKILVISAYSKFEYAQKALTLGASDYLLKPIKEQVFINAFQKLCREIAAEKRKQEEDQGIGLMLKDYQNAVENECISDILLEEVNEKGFQKYLDTLNHPFYGAFIVSVRILNAAEEGLREAYEAFRQDMKKICTCIGKVQKHMLILCVIPSAAGSPEKYKAILADNLACVMEKNGEYAYAVEVSTFKRTVQELFTGTTESRLALFSVHSPGVHFRDAKAKEESGISFSYPEEKNACIRLAEQKQYPKLAELLMQIISRAEKNDEPFRTFQIYVLDLMHSILRKMTSGEAVQRYPLFFMWTYWEKILSQQTYSGLSEAVNRILQQCFSSPKADKQYNRYITSSLDYIAKHYMDDLALETVAAQNRISSFYLSRLFKQELNHTFLEVLTDIRISKALELLCSHHYSAQEISEKCGYLNVSYFYKLFKKQTGMTFGEMRNLLCMMR